MHFIHQSNSAEDTIAAIATPAGSGGVAIIRLSGSQAIAIADRFFSGDVYKYRSHTVHYGKVLDADGLVVDDALLIPMLKERSYTGEDTVEIQCHGGALITKKILNILIVDGGARAAGPGEYTMRSFLNGKIDLAQAESVQELIAAQSSMALDAANDQLQGKLSKKVKDYQSRLTEIAAIVEAWVDFPEEGLEYISEEQLLNNLKVLREDIYLLLKTFDDGHKIKTGITLCLVGAPNVGKSSLMNALLGTERAIVTDIAGTTRDILEEGLIINNMHFNLIDTAGIRECVEVVEREGIRRARAAVAKADLVLFLVDATRGFTDLDHSLWEELPKEKTICILNKVDLPHDDQILPDDLGQKVYLSALKQTGIEELKSAIDNIIWRNGPPAKGEVVLTNSRHKDAVKNSLAAIDRVIVAFEQNISPEFIALDLRQALQSLGIIIGTDITEDVLSSIFSKFCIGK